jgi:hypothetical protein
MPNDSPKYWFPAKKIGWGWGPPTCWQGWLVMVVWLLLLAGGAFVLMPNTAAFIIYTVIMATVLTIICWLKGEKPRWRSGND